MADYVEGKRAVIEALRSDVPLKRVYLADNEKRHPLVEDIKRKAKQRNLPVELVPRSKLDELSERGSHQGVMAQVAPFPYAGIGDVVAAANAYAEANDGRALIVVLDHITDAGNFGAVIRSAECVGASGIIIPNKRSARVEASTYKSSAGAVAHVPIAQTSNIVQSLERMKKEGFWICGATEHAQDLLWDTNLKGKMVIVMGNEQEGIARLVLEHCDMMAKLPIAGQVGSLNVAQAATACMYEWLRQNQ